MAYTDIDKPSDYFNTKIFSGDNSANNSVTGVGFQPDFIWFKNRNAANDHALVNSVRGRKSVSTNNANAELTLNADKDFQSFDSDGFTVDVVEQLNSFNKSGDSLVSWNWKESATAGFDIVAYTGNATNRTISHSCGSAVKMIITKSRAGNNWFVYHESMGNTDMIKLNQTNAKETKAAIWNSTSPTSSVFSLGTDNDANESGVNFIAYCFADVQGFSKVSGSYTGNGNADGTFVYTGFKPAWVMVKKSSATNNWVIQDNKRNPHNMMTEFLMANVSDAESTGLNFDFLSNGFKLRSASGGTNTSGATYIYMAFAEQPFVTSSGVPATAR